MGPWENGQRHESWASNGNLVVYGFAAAIGVAWLGFQIWADVGGPPAPEVLNPLLPTAIAAAITNATASGKRHRRRYDDEEDDE